MENKTNTAKGKKMKDVYEIKGNSKEGFIALKNGEFWSMSDTKKSLKNSIKLAEYRKQKLEEKTIVIDGVRYER